MPDIRVTHFGLVRDQGEFIGTRCKAFNYNKHAHMKMAYTFGARRSTNFTSPNTKSVSLGSTTNAWASSTTMRIGEKSSAKGFGQGYLEVSDRG